VGTVRIGELLRSSVVDADGKDIGSVDDVRLVQDGPILDGFGSALRVDALIIGEGSLAVRLGYHRHRVKGPWLLKRLFGALERRAVVVPWDQVVSWDGQRVVLARGEADLPRVSDVY
jgi:sporulation protein YlmC with PRC-barrel domain